MSALLREISNLRDNLDSRISGETAVMNARIAAIDHATVVFQENLTRVPTAVDKAVSNLAALHGEKFSGVEKLLTEKFAGVEKQFRERDVRVDTSATQTKLAIDAALQAAKEAVGEQNRSSALSISKSEAGTAKQIDQLGMLLQSATKALDEKNDDLKERLTRLEGQQLGGSTKTTEWHQSTGLIISAIAILMTIVTFAMTYLRR
jgi:hypothetical protein